MTRTWAGYFAGKLLASDDSIFGSALVVGTTLAVGDGSTYGTNFNVTSNSTSNNFTGGVIRNAGISGAVAGLAFMAYDWVQGGIWHGRGTTSSKNGALVLGTNPDTSVLGIAGLTGRVFIFNNGNVGINTSTDTGYKLQVAGTSTFSGQMIQGGGAPRSTSGVTIALNLSGAVYSANSDPGDTGRFFSIVNETSTLNAFSALSFRVNPNSGGSSGNAMLDMKFANNGSGTSALYWSFLSAGSWYDRMTLTSDGALCIGVNTPYGTNILNVNGGVYATGQMAAVISSNVDMFTFVNTNASYTHSCFVGSIAAAGSTSSYYFYGQQSTSTVALKIFTNGNIQNTNNSYGAISDASDRLEQLRKLHGGN